MFNKRVARKRSRSQQKNLLPYFEAFLRRAIPFVMAGIVVLVIALFVRGVLLSVPYLDVKDVKVVCNKDASDSLDFLKNYSMLKTCKGKNIFEVDIQGIEKMIRRDHPEFKSLQVNRVLPGTIEIKVVVRIPVVIVKLSDYYPIDSDGYVMSPRTKFAGNLPIITGLTLSKRVTVGSRIDSVQVKGVLVTLKDLQNIKALKTYGIQRVEISNINNFNVILNNGLEVRIGEGDLNNKLKRLKMILEDPKIDKNNLRYIDLRFKDTVFGTR